MTPSKVGVPTNVLTEIASECARQDADRGQQDQGAPSSPRRAEGPHVDSSAEGAVTRLPRCLRAGPRSGPGRAGLGAPLSRSRSVLT